jgi:hypothetical protein
MTITEYVYQTKIRIKHTDGERSVVEAHIYAPSAIEAVRRLAKRFGVDVEELEDLYAETDGNSRDITEKGELAA